MSSADTSGVTTLGIPARCSASIPSAEQIWPEVQKPHWKASSRTNASCRGCSRPGCPTPSIVVMSRSAYCTASARHAAIRSPSTSTVQAPQAPWSHPFLVPVSPRCSRRASSRLTRGSRSRSSVVPFTRSFTGITAPQQGNAVSVFGGLGSFAMTTKAGFRRARRPEQKRQRYAAILDAARELALREGVGVVSLADIAARVGMHKSALLKYFETREEIFLRLAETEFAEWSAGVLAALSVADREPHEVADVLAGSVADRPLLCQLLLFAPLTLERKVSPDAVRAFKLAM